MSYALITGGAKGIGKAIAEELGARNYNLILIGSDGDELYGICKIMERRYGVEVLPLHIDLASANATEEIISLTRPYHDQLSVVVNNAGYGLSGAFEQISLNDQLNIIDVNIKALVKLSHAYIPVLKKSNKGFLLNVSSATAYQTVPYFNVYASTKAFVLSFTRGLWHEFRQSNLSVSCLVPGSTDTNSVDREGMSTKKRAAKYGMTAQAVAKAAVNGLFKGEREIVPGFINKLNAFFPRFFPARLIQKMPGNIYEKKDRLIDPAFN